MFSLQNMSAVEEANLRFIVGSGTSKAPLDLAHHFHWHGTYARDGQIVDTLTPRKHTRGSNPTLSKRARPAWDPARHPQAWRAVWQYRRKRAMRDERTLNQIGRASCRERGTSARRAFGSGRRGGRRGISI